MICRIVSAAVAGLLLSTSAMAGAPSVDLPLMPYPQQVDLQEGRLAIGKDFKIFLEGYASERLEALARRTIDRVEMQTGLPLLSPWAMSKDEATLVISVKEGPKQPVQGLESDEIYSLVVAGTQAKLTADRPLGVIRGVETFLQLIQTDAGGHYMPSVDVSDAPRFPWRGASLDTARHFITPETIKRQIDGFASAKMNVFHWHLWDDQAIRIELESYPKLWQLNSDGDYYTKEQIREIVEYARQRGVRVIPEISLPGHASAVAHAYPELMAGLGEQAYPRQRQWGVFEPLMDPTNPELYTFLEAVFAEVVDLFPDAYIHIGGDEPNYAQWKNNPEIQQFIKDNGHDGERGLQSYLNARVEKILEDHGKKMMGWDEIWHKDLPKSIVIQSWRGHDSLGRAAKQGYAGVLSTGFYMDQPQPTSYHYRNDPMPQGLSVDDKVHEGEQFESYSWIKPRGKGGPRKGTLTIIRDEDGNARAFTDYNGKSRAEVDIIEYEPNKRFRGGFDNFMSYTEFNLWIEDGQFTADSYQLVGNVRWPSSGELIASTQMEGTSVPAPSGGYPVTLTADQQDLILGGEAAIWAENYNDLTLENRIWPRTYAVGERLWSSEDLTDIDSMYDRMQEVDQWATVSVGLEHALRREKQLIRLANGADVEPLRVLAEYAEPAQYYARNWAKYNATEPKGLLYNQSERLNRFADALPVESLAVRTMEQLAQTPDNPEALSALNEYLQKAMESARRSADIFAGNVSAVGSVELAERHVAVAEAALAVIEAVRSGDEITEDTIDALMDVTKENAGTYDECIVAIVRPVEVLARSLRAGLADS